MLALTYNSLRDYPNSLAIAGICVGIFLILSHGFAFVKATTTLQAAQTFPRNQTIGRILLGIAAFWSWSILKPGGLDLGFLHFPELLLGELNWLRTPALWLIPIFFFLICRFANEFLAVRALGCLCLLVASLLLDVAWLKFVHPSRVLLPLYCYLLISVGMIFVAWPYRLRDVLTWLSSQPKYWKIALLAGVIYGIALTTSALLWWQ